MTLNKEVSIDLTEEAIVSTKYYYLNIEVTLNYSPWFT